MSELLNAILGFGSGVLDVLDMPGSYLRGALGGRLGERLSGRDMLEEWGILGENQEGFDVGDVAGFGADVLFDPLNALGGVGIARKLSQIGKHNKTSEALRAAGAMPEEVAALTKVVNDTGDPLRTYHGTSHRFDQFNLDSAKPSALFGKGIYTTENPIVASGYAGVGAKKEASAQSLLKEAMEGFPRKKRMVEQGLEDPNEFLGLDFFRERALRAQDDVLRLRDPAEHVRMQYLDFRNPFFPDKTYSAEEVAELMKHAGPDAAPLVGDQSGQELFRFMNPTKGNTPENLAQYGFDSLIYGGKLGFLPHSELVAMRPDQVYKPFLAPEMRSAREAVPLLAALLGYNTLQALGDSQ